MSTTATAEAPTATPAVFLGQLQGPDVWSGTTIGGKDGLRFYLEEKHLQAIDALLAATRHLEPQAVTRAQFDHPDLNPVLAELFQLIQHGRGAVIITGITPDRYSPEDFERIYWGFGLHWGTAVMQSSQGDHIGRVRFTPVGPDNPANRAYRSDDELTLHTDSTEIVGLMCVSPAAEGGYSELVNVLAIHNDIAEQRPDLLAPLYTGYYYASREASLTGRPVTDHKVPILGCVDGRVSCHYVRQFMTVAATKLGEPFPEDLKEALDFFDQRARAHHIRFMLEPGEIMMMNNFTTLHARTAFKNSETQKRELLRHWLHVADGRAVNPHQIRRPPGT